MIFVNPEHLVSEATAGNVLQFNIKASSPHSFNRLLITSKADNEFSKTELDSVLIPVKNFNFSYEFLVPVKPENYNMNLTFRIYNQEGVEANATRRLIVSSSIPVSQE